MIESERRKTEAALLALELVSRRALRRALGAVVAQHIFRYLSAPAVAAAAGARDLEGIVTDQVAVARAAGASGGRRTALRELALPLAAAATALIVPGSGIRASAIGRRVGDLFVANASTSLQEAAQAVRGRLDTIAASETSSAFSQGRDREFLAAVKDGRIDGPVTMQWSAVLDSRVCPTCSGLHGKTAPLGQDFDGYTPGNVHGRCRCTSFPIGRIFRMAA